MDTNIDRIERLARKRAAAKMGWLIHATVFTIVNSMLLVSPALLGRHASALPMPLLGWATGLMIHGLVVWLCPSGAGLSDTLVERERRLLMREPGR